MGLKVAKNIKLSEMYFFFYNLSNENIEGFTTEMAIIFDGI